MPADDGPTDGEMSRRRSQTMNALIRGGRTDDRDEQGQEDDHTDEPADMNARIRRAAGRPDNHNTKE